MIFFILFSCHDHGVCSGTFIFYFTINTASLGSRVLPVMFSWWIGRFHSAQWVQMRWRNRELIVGGAVSVWWVRVLLHQVLLKLLRFWACTTWSFPPNRILLVQVPKIRSGGARTILVRLFEVESIDVAAPPLGTPAWGILIDLLRSPWHESVCLYRDEISLFAFSIGIGIIELLRIGSPSPS